ncbi:hypothetical protein ACWEN3_44930, partial [Streptomyces sp. NPDC004561]
MAARLPSWAWVTGLTAGATAAVVALAVQADHGSHPTAAVAKPGASASARAHASTKPKAPAVPLLVHRPAGGEVRAADHRLARCAALTDLHSA